MAHSKDSSKRPGRFNRTGVALILALLMLSIFSATAVFLAASSAANLRSAANQAAAQQAFTNAASGTEIMRFVLTKVEGFSPGSSNEETLLALRDAIGDVLDDYGIAMTVEYGSLALQVAPMTLCSGDFAACLEIAQFDGDDAISLAVTGTSGCSSRRIAACYEISPGSASPIFGYGVATRGPLHMSGNAHFHGVNDLEEASVYIDASGLSSAFSIAGSCGIHGPVGIVNDDVSAVTWTGYPSLGGVGVPTWSYSHNNVEHLNLFGVHVGLQTMDFPTPDPASFRHYATGPEITGSMSSVYTLENAIVKANANPHFTGVVTVNGILYIEQPNEVTFGGSVNINGFIVAEGDPDNPLPGNSITFTGNVQTASAATLPHEPAFEGLRDKSGISILAPGFELNIGATFDSISGSIAGNGINFFGNPQVTVGGTLINYSSDPLTLAGSAKLRFDKSNANPNPDGFIPPPGGKLAYIPDSYAEPPAN